VSKESVIKKRIEKIERENQTAGPPEKKSSSSTIVPVTRRSKRKLNKKFIITFAIWLIALIAALFFLTKGT
jgi:hypothetical protein